MDLINNFELKNLECASEEQCKHILKVPVKLDCGHFICQQCISNRNEKIICKICKKVNDSDLEKSNEIESINNLINNNLNHLFDTLHEQFNLVLNDVQENFEEAKNVIEMQFEFVKEEIEIRIESLRINLDSIYEKLCQELFDKKNDYIKFVLRKLNKNESTLQNYVIFCLFSKIDEFKLHIEQGKAESYKLEKTIEDKANKTVEAFYNYQELLKKLNKLNENLKNIDKKVSFEASNENINEEMVGKPVYIDPLLIKIRNGIYTVIELDIKLSTDVCLIAENRLLVAVEMFKELNLYDENLNLINSMNKKNQKFHEKPFSPFSVTSNMKNRIFVSDRDHHNVFAIDYEFYPIYYVGTFGSRAKQFNTPSGVYFQNGYLYVCDCRNRRIQILNEELEFQTFYPLDFQPYQIKINNQVVCIRECVDENNGRESIYFYDLMTFTQKFKYSGHSGSICIINSYFYVFHAEKRSLKCYNKDGSFNCETQLALPYNIYKSDFHPLICFNNKILIFAIYSCFVI